MAVTKTAGQTFHIETELKETLRSAAERGCRSIANWRGREDSGVCGRAGVAITEATRSPLNKKTANK